MPGIADPASVVWTWGDGTAPEFGDRARVRIWHGGAGKNGHLMFDSQVGDPIGADATGSIQGNVTLHVK